MLWALNRKPGWLLSNSRLRNPKITSQAVSIVSWVLLFSGKESEMEIRREMKHQRKERDEYKSDIGHRFLLPFCQPPQFSNIFFSWKKNWDRTRYPSDLICHNSSSRASTLQGPKTPGFQNNWVQLHTCFFNPHVLVLKSFVGSLPNFRGRFGGNSTCTEVTGAFRQQMGWVPSLLHLICKQVLWRHWRTQPVANGRSKHIRIHWVERKSHGKPRS